jgi:hypothetical protein
LLRAALLKAHKSRTKMTAPDEKWASRAWLCHILRRFEGSIFRGYSGARG